MRTSFSPEVFELPLIAFIFSRSFPKLSAEEKSRSGKLIEISPFPSQMCSETSTHDGWAFHTCSCSLEILVSLEGTCGKVKFQPIKSAKNNYCIYLSAKRVLTHSLHGTLIQSWLTALNTVKWHRLSQRDKIIFEGLDYPLSTAPAIHRCMHIDTHCFPQHISNLQSLL